MTSMTPPVSAKEVERLLRESQHLKTESANLKPKSRWLAYKLNQILEENHLSDRIRNALGD